MEDGLGDDHPEWKKGPDEKAHWLVMLLFWGGMLVSIIGLSFGSGFALFGHSAAAVWCLKVAAMGAGMMIISLCVGGIIDQPKKRQ